MILFVVLGLYYLYGFFQEMRVIPKNQKKLNRKIGLLRVRKFYQKI